MRDNHGGCQVAKPLVTVVILNFNGERTLQKCLQSVLTTDYAPIEVVVVDNASSDQSLQCLQELSQQVVVVRNERNLGYSGGNRRGLELAHGDFVVFLNNDVVVEPNWIAELVKAADRTPDAALVQPKILFHDRRTINSAGGIIHVAGFGLCIGIGETDDGQWDSECEIDYASGACLFVRRKVLNDIGFLDDRYVAYEEDVDWGWRAKTLGWKSIVAPRSLIFHEARGVMEGVMPAMKFYYLERNRLLTVAKNYSTPSLVRLLPILGVIEFFVLAYSLARRLMGWKVRSYCDAFKLRSHVRSQRQRIQSRRKVPDSEIVGKLSWTLWHPYVGPSIRPLNWLVRLLMVALGYRHRSSDRGPD